ncbi:MAG: hypothetical protein JRF31_03720 [Deltaproteobacteria bacterium]|nr:hypothetical protein [Deltaproteobacteria bacterium]MBW1958008.1 hypothetical protein [Deltaproteobacteria bacterium]MBW2013967.1 hypothetical protein [Deltaproteobacteria bacterium]MBW2088479.1 hypothetical protein [Deltaproteobacteria bacterium]MBW2319954.1 hypothetical protein [Deltaproteobacteria bacterium]
MKIFNWRKAVFGGILLLVLCGNLYAATRQRIESALESARTELRISIATEEHIASELAKLKKSEDTPSELIENYELYLSRVQAMVAEHRKRVAKIEALHARYDIRKAPTGSAYGDDTEAMINPAIPEEQVVDEVVALDRQLDSSLAQFDEMLLKELDLIRAKSSERMRDLAEEAAAAAKRLRDQGIEINEDFGEESAESGQDSTQAQKTAEMEKDASETGKEKKANEDKDDSELSVRDISQEGVEGSRNHPKNRYDPKDDDIVARQLREASEEETDPELRKKLWKEYEHYKKNKGK